MLCYFSHLCQHEISYFSLTCSPISQPLRILPANYLVHFQGLKKIELWFLTFSRFPIWVGTLNVVYWVNLETITTMEGVFFKVNHTFCVNLVRINSNILCVFSKKTLGKSGEYNSNVWGVFSKDTAHADGDWGLFLGLWRVWYYNYKSDSDYFKPECSWCTFYKSYSTL